MSSTQTVRSSDDTQIGVHTDEVYLVRGAEIPFGPEHVIEIADPPADYIDEMRGAVPSRRWPRG